MLPVTGFIAETIMIEPSAAPSASPFDDALEDLRITGSLLLHETYTPPWAIDIPREDVLRQMLGVGSDARALPFHLVRRGAFDLSNDGRPPVRINTHEVAICPSGASHRMWFGAGAAPVSVAHILATRGAGANPSCANSSSYSCEAAAGTELVCGVFLLRAAPLNPLLASLPPVLKVKTAGSEAKPMLARAVEMLSLELAEGGRGGFTASRLLEVFFAEAINAYRQSEGAERPGWFNALNDPKIGPAIAQVHDRPGAPWTVASMAETVAMSPSRFAARFRESTGQSAMTYVASWRMTIACRMLRETKQDLAGVASEIGYQDVASFSRAFKAHIGESPARWRSRAARFESRSGGGGAKE
jgi:AraC-like DNA-binding protein